MAFLLCAAILVGVGLLQAVDLEWDWVVQAGGYGYDYGRSIAIDSFGNQYVSGYFQYSVSFGSTTLTSSGDHDLFAAKLDGNGNFLWARKFGGSGDDYARGIAVDHSGNVYVTGFYEGTATFGTISLTSNGGYDICAVKLNNDGDVLWASGAGGPGHDWGYGIVAGEASGVYITGHFTENASFGSTMIHSSGSYDIFTAKLDGNGNWLWAVRAGGTGIDESFGLAVDDSDNICLTGHFQNTATFGSFTLTSMGGDDIFAAKLDNSGNWIWAKRAGGSSYDYGFGVTVNAGNVYITGRFRETAYFGTTTLTSSGMEDIFAAKLDFDGNFIWTTRAGGDLNDRSDAIIVDPDGNVYLTGCFSGVADFGTTTLASSGGDDIFAAQLDSGGNFSWAVKAGGPDNDHGYGIVLDISRNIYLIGYFRYYAEFGPYWFNGNGSEDIFVAKLGTAELPLPVILNSFSASLAPENAVLLEWVTQSETNMLGYNIWRSDSYNLDTASVHNASLIPATNTSEIQCYTYTDYGVVEGNTYFYWLEALSYGSNYFFFGPVSILVQNTEVGDESNPSNPQESRIMNAWPNPFRKDMGISIEVNVKAGGKGTAAVYNLRGQKLTEYSLGEGHYSLFWNGRDANGKACDSGVYFFRLETPSLLQTRKLVIIN